MSSTQPPLLEAFRRDGWVLVPKALSDMAVTSALRAIDERAKEEISEFPTGIRDIDRLVESEPLIETASTLYGPELLLHNAHVFLRYASSEPEGPRSGGRLHYDQDTDCYLPAGEDGRFGYLNCHVLLENVRPPQAPMIVYPGTHIETRERLRTWRDQERLDGKANFIDGGEPEDLPDPVTVCGEAGDALFYSSTLLHRAQRFGETKQRRMLFAITFCRFGAYRRSWPHPFRRRATTDTFIAATTPRVRSLLGWPPPGDSYYTPGVLAELAAWYPDLDIDPYRSRGSSHG